MKILILDKEYLTSRSYVYPWIATLRSRNHVVHDETFLRNLGVRGYSITQYDVAVVHPDKRDIKRLYGELSKRRDFRIILHSGNQPHESFELVPSTQFYYCAKFPATETLVNLIEKGWERKE